MVKRILEKINSSEQIKNNYFLENYNYEQMILSEINSFFQIALQKEFDNVYYYKIKLINQNNFDLLITENFFIVPSLEDGWVFIEAVKPLTQENKESLIDIMEIGENYNCNKIIALINRNNPLYHQIIRSFLILGFSLVEKPELELFNYILLIKNFE
jgi:hypothetical protein